MPIRYILSSHGHMVFKLGRDFKFVCIEWLIKFIETGATTLCSDCWNWPDQDCMFVRSIKAKLI